ncbi:hypothetical protein CA51_29920 [Rosistilla oblonga]|nr:hypothetical protein CA51_29920 [Rosistilla oblonga]
MVGQFPKLALRKSVKLLGTRRFLIKRAHIVRLNDAERERQRFWDSQTFGAFWGQPNTVFWRFGDSQTFSLLKQSVLGTAKLSAYSRRTFWGQPNFQRILGTVILSRAFWGQPNTVFGDSHSFGLLKPFGTGSWCFAWRWMGDFEWTGDVVAGRRWELSLLCPFQAIAASDNRWFGLKMAAVQVSLRDCGGALRRGWTN